MGLRGEAREDLTENKKSDEARLLRRKWLRNAETGQRRELGINGNGSSKYAEKTE